jgi:hypothetical protein
MSENFEVRLDSKLPDSELKDGLKKIWIGDGYEFYFYRNQAGQACFSFDLCMGLEHEKVMRRDVFKYLLEQSSNSKIFYLRNPDAGQSDAPTVNIDDAVENLPPDPFDASTVDEKTVYCAWIVR